MTLSPRYVKAGFSLTELLIAIGVLALLIAFGMSAALSMRKSQHVVACMNQQRQIGVAMLAYAADHSGRLPAFISGGKILSSTGNQNSLANQLIPPKGSYLPGKEIFADPAALGRIYTKGSSGWYDWANGQSGRSGYWHIYISPHSTEHKERAADTSYGANDTVRAAPYKVLMHCYHAGSLSDCAHPRGEVNVLRVDGSVSTYQRHQYRPGRLVLDNFDHVRP